MASTRSRKQEEPPLPQELVLEILLRVPVKALIKCICVCRAWQSLIKSPSFITSHSKYQLMINKHYDSKLVFLIERDKGSYCLLSHNGAAFTKVENTKFPFLFDYYNCFITSSNGLLCLDLKVDFGRHIFLWNPSVRRFKFIETTTCSYKITTHYALGLDEFHNEYKVVKIYGEPTKADVYSLTTNSWHTTLLGNNKDINATIHNSRTHAHANGAIHWLAFFGNSTNYRFLKSDLAILSFDFTKEVLGDFSLPAEWCNDQIKEALEEDLKVLNGMLAFIVSCNSFVVEQSVCYLWLMKEYGVAESWTKAYTIVLGTECYWPLGFTNTGKFLYYLYNESRVMSYDPASKRSTNVGVENSLITQAFFDFTESLILLDQGNVSMEQALKDCQSNKSTNVGVGNSSITQAFFDFKENLILLDQVVRRWNRN